MDRGLEELEVLVVDCQTTGATPAHGHLIELAWGAVAACRLQELQVECHTLRLPEGESVPSRISAITGISDEDISRGLDPPEAWRRFSAALADRSGHVRPLVAHYSRFEELWLKDLRSGAGSGEGPPLEFICTREMARRLYPGLPRKGLHALSGYMGRTMPELKRAGDHVKATAFAWSKMTALLAGKGVDSLEALLQWLQEPPEPAGRRILSLPREKRLSLPDEPGIYRFLGADGAILYVGKATSLKRRVSSYFTKRKADEKTLELVTQVHDVSVTRCGSPLEAALLECRLIRRHNPPYNRALRAGDETLWFCSREGDSWGTVPSPVLCTGPFRSRDPHDRLAFLLDLASGRTEAGDGEVESLFYLDGSGIEPGAVEDGLSMLCDEFTALGLTGSRRKVLELGRDLWHEMLLRREEAALEECEDDDPDAEEEEEERLLTAEDVFARLRWTTAEAAVAERRSRWFRLLAWSTVSWTPPSAPDAGRRFLVLRNGGVLSSGHGVPDTAVPPPVRSMSPVITRTGFEVLGVLTGELRRVSSDEGAGTEVLLPTGKTLAGEPLTRLLRMV
jgi:DNA polymerase-3 subunit epsilon